MQSGNTDSYGSTGAGIGGGMGTRSSGNTGAAYGSGTGTQDSSYGQTDSYGSTGQSTGSGNKNDDSKLGQFMEKAGGMFNSDKLKEKGQQKRDNAGSGGYNDDSGNY